MDKRSIERKMTTHVKGAMFISRLQIEKFMGYGRAKTQKLLEGLEVIEMDGRRKYFIPDVCQRIMERSIRK